MWPFPRAQMSVCFALGAQVQSEMVTLLDILKLSENRMDSRVADTIAMRASL